MSHMSIAMSTTIRVDRECLPTLGVDRVSPYYVWIGDVAHEYTDDKHTV